jgi:hypothetical protein
MSRATISPIVMCTATGAPLGIPGCASTDSLCGSRLLNWLVKFSFSCWEPGLRGPLLHRVSSSSLARSLPSGGACLAISLNSPLSILTSLPSNTPQCFLFRSSFCVCLLTSVLFLLRIGWAALPYPPTPFGTGNKRHCCVGCRLVGLSADPYVIRCSFSDAGFPFLDGSPAYPCYSAYHTGCFSVGPPFVSRQKNGSGLMFPKVKTWPNFICEACTVRAMVGRELTGPSDWKLLCFERMRILDMAHYWALGAHDKYQGKLAAISRFETEYDLCQRILRPTRLLRPPAGADIGLMWMMESHSLRTAPLRGTDEMQLLSNTAVQQLRSATSQYLAWDLMVSKPEGVYFDQQKRLICQPCRLTDGLGCSLFASGIASRIGKNVNPSVVLLDRHYASLVARMAALF